MKVASSIPASSQSPKAFGLRATVISKSNFKWWNRPLGSTGKENRGRFCVTEDEWINKWQEGISSFLCGSLAYRHLLVCFFTFINSNCSFVGCIVQHLNHDSLTPWRFQRTDRRQQLWFLKGSSSVVRLWLCGDGSVRRSVSEVFMQSTTKAINLNYSIWWHQLFRIEAFRHRWHAAYHFQTLPPLLAFFAASSNDSCSRPLPCEVFAFLFLWEHFFSHRREFNGSSWADFIKFIFHSFPELRRSPVVTGWKHPQQPALKVYSVCQSAFLCSLCL